MKQRVWSRLARRFRHLNAGKILSRTAVGLSLGALAVTVAVTGFLLRVNLSTASSLELLLVLLVALRLGFLQASVASVTAVLSLNFLFTAPVFTFVVADPQNWVSLFTFEATALLVSGLSTKVKTHAAQADEQRIRAIRLYELSRAVLLIDQRGSTSDQLCALVRQIFEVDEVHLWTEYETNDWPKDAAAAQINQQSYQAYREEREDDDFISCCSHRVLRIGTNIIGGMTMRKWRVDSLAADAVASIVAITYARTRAIQQENRAEVERDAERLRTAVLDGLAHSFKTPLTAIKTASSGLLAIEHLSPTQLELVSIIDERGTMLSQLTTRLLQTAALEARDIHLRRSDAFMSDLLHRIVDQQEEDVRARINIALPPNLMSDQLDVSMIELALQQLIDNAVKYSAVGSAIQIMIEQNASEMVVAVVNAVMTGSSIRKEEHTRIFERFYRGYDAVHGAPGTGLGLSIVKKIAEAHGGRAWMECNEAMTRFHLSIQRYEKVKNG